MRRHLLLLLALTGCDAVEDDLPGKLVRVEVIAEADTCTPLRFTGDAGVQFFGQRIDGGLALTMSSQAQYGPTPDGGTLTGTGPSLVVAATGSENAPCFISLSDWRRTEEGLRLEQHYPGSDVCTNGTSLMPKAACISSRRFVFTELRDCPLRCVHIPPGSDEVECSC